MEGAFLQSFHNNCNRSLVAQPSGLDQREYTGGLAIDAIL